MRPPSSGLSARVREWLARHGSPVSSARLLEMFLRMAALPEDQATRLLAPSLEGAGLRYEPGAGWSVEAAPAAGASLRVVAVPDPGTEGMALAVSDPSDGAREASPADLAGGGVVFVVRDRADALPLRAWLAARGLPGPGAVISWRAALRGKLRLPRGAGLDSVAATLGLRWHDEESPRSTAIAIAACLHRAEDAAGGPPGFAPAGAAMPCRVPREQIDALPAAPGTYRFYAEDGSLLYVGKARDLRQRVTSYFRPGRRGGHGARFLPHAVRLEHQAEGSELEALLREARVLARRAPPGNVQLAVHERGRQYGAACAWALLLPRAHDDGVTAVLVRDGRYLGHLTLGPRGGGLPAARRLLGRALHPGAGSPGARKGRAPSRDGLPDRDTEILMSWLARNRDEVSRVELDSFGTPPEALRALRDAARSVRLHPDRVIIRGAPRSMMDAEIAEDTMEDTRYGIRVEVPLAYDQAVERAQAALKAEGFGVLTTIDVQQTLKQKLDRDFRKYVILGACNPALADRAFQAELEIGLLLPCNVIVYEAAAQRSVVAAMAPIPALGLTGTKKPELQAVAREADERLRRALASLETP